MVEGGVGGWAKEVVVERGGMKRVVGELVEVSV